MAPGDIAVLFSTICGTGLALLLLAGPIGAIIIAIQHRRIHGRLGLPSGFSPRCPRCLDDQQRRDTPWPTVHARDWQRKRLKQEEFEDSGHR